MPLALNDLAANTIGLVANDALLHAVAIEFFPAAALRLRTAIRCRSSK